MTCTETPATSINTLLVLRAPLRSMLAARASSARGSVFGGRRAPRRAGGHSRALAASEYETWGAQEAQLCGAAQRRGQEGRAAMGMMIAPDTRRRASLAALGAGAGACVHGAAQRAASARS